MQDYNCSLDYLRSEVFAQRFRDLGQLARRILRYELFKSYVLLTQMKSEPIGKLYQQHQENIKKVLRKRNNSLFAHGFSLTES